MNFAVGGALVNSLPRLPFDRRSHTCSCLIPKLNKRGAPVGVAEQPPIPVLATFAVSSGLKPICSPSEVRLREDPEGSGPGPGHLESLSGSGSRLLDLPRAGPPPAPPEKERKQTAKF